MQQKFWRLFRFCVLSGIILNMVACNGTDSTTIRTQLTVLLRQRIQ